MIDLLIKNKGVVYENQKVKACFTDKYVSSWTGLGSSRHVQIMTFPPISHISYLENRIRSNSIMIQHGSASRNPENTFKPIKTNIFSKTAKRNKKHIFFMSSQAHHRLWVSTV